MNTNRRILVPMTAILLTMALVLAPSAISDNAFAKKYKNWSDCREDHSKNWCKKYFKNDNDDNKKSGNKASQAIGQAQSSSQNSQCVSGGSTFASCNNLSIQNQINTGNNALAQDSNGKGGNKASQAIGQAQSSSQNSQVVSGGNTVGSGNNINVQNQVNTGNNALAQQ